MASDFDMEAILLNLPNGYEICKKVINKIDNNMNVEIQTNGELNLIKVLSKLKDIKIVFDIGANVGNYSREVLKYIKNLEKIYLFDPVPENITICKKNIINNAVVFTQAAVSNIDGTTKFFQVNILNSGHSSIYDMNTIGYLTNSQEIICDAITIDTFCKNNLIEKIDFLKLDIEGHELNALFGMQSILENKKIRFIQFEFGHASRASRTLFLDFINFFKKYDFDIYVIKPEAFEKVIYTPFFENKYDVANFLACHSSEFALINNLSYED
ncbi:MAG TPA: hypothetical protein CFH84_11560 [Sulfurimonas sp. UBA12504]|nr:MAG TPA: hypothetical protein CFH84_11560 [Sulfurimonas sp. UBA12504]